MVIDLAFTVSDVEEGCLSERSVTVYEEEFAFVPSLLQVEDDDVRLQEFWDYVTGVCDYGTEW